MSWLYGQTWLWYLIAFLVGVLLAWLFLVRPQQRRLDAVQSRATGDDAVSMQKAGSGSTPTEPVTAKTTPVVPQAEPVTEEFEPVTEQFEPVTEQIPAVDPALSTLDSATVAQHGGHDEDTVVADRTPDEQTVDIRRDEDTVVTGPSPDAPVDDQTVEVTPSESGTSTGTGAAVAAGGATALGVAADATTGTDGSADLTGTGATAPHASAGGPATDKAGGAGATPAANPSDGDAAGDGVVGAHAGSGGGEPVEVTGAGAPVTEGLSAGRHDVAAAATSDDTAPEPAVAGTAALGVAGLAAAGAGRTGEGRAPAGTPYGPGSAHPAADGSSPHPDYAIKGNADSRLYHTTESPYYVRTRAEAWFATIDAAEAAGFQPWHRNRKTAAVQGLAAPAPTFEPGKYAGSAKPRSDGSAPTDGFTIKGNEDSMLYHLPSSPYYGRTRAEVWFANEADAEAAGFTQYRRK